MAPEGAKSNITQTNLKAMVGVEGSSTIFYIYYVINIYFLLLYTRLKGH